MKCFQTQSVVPAIKAETHVSVGPPCSDNTASTHQTHRRCPKLTDTMPQTAGNAPNPGCDHRAPPRRPDPVMHGHTPSQIASTEPASAHPQSRAAVPSSRAVQFLLLLPVHPPTTSLLGVSAALAAAVWGLHPSHSHTTTQQHLFALSFWSAAPRHERHAPHHHPAFEALFLEPEAGIRTGGTVKRMVLSDKLEVLTRV